VSAPPVAPAPARPWPVELEFRDAARLLAIRFDDGRAFDIPFELLRVESPSAEVQGHSAAQRKVVRGKENVRVTAAEPIGRYAVRLIFDDGHDSGLFTWDWLHRLGRDRDALMAEHRARGG
jgi:DUF971 family protein